MEQPVKGLVESSLLLFKQTLPAGQGPRLVFFPGMTRGQAGPKSDEQKLVGFRKFILICFGHFFVLPGFGHLAESLLITKSFRHGRITSFGVMIVPANNQAASAWEGKNNRFQIVGSIPPLSFAGWMRIFAGPCLYFNANGLPNLSSLLELAVGGGSQFLLGCRRRLLRTP